MARLNFTPFPTLTTERLTLRQLTDEDDKEIFFLRSDKTVNQYITRPIPSGMDDARAFIQKINNAIAQNNSIYWAICLHDKPILVGTICLWNFSDDNSIAELGYELIPASQGQGIMNEALKRIIIYAFETLKIEKLEAFTHKDNISSTQLLVKNNFKREPGRVDEENIDIVVYFLNR
jgi:[ribosomal protein S5]-alanine N-acetyltransferase